MPPKILKDLSKRLLFIISHTTPSSSHVLAGHVISTTDYRKPIKSSKILHYNAKMLFQYKLAALRSYINCSIMICSNEKLLKQEMECIIDIATKAGYKKYSVWILHKKQIKKLNHIEKHRKIEEFLQMQPPFN